MQAAVLPQLNVTLSHFAADEGPVNRKDAALDEVLKALVELEASSNRNWRLQVRAVDTDTGKTGGVDCAGLLMGTGTGQGG